MTNFVFISPNFPTNYWMFCRELKNNGINVLGIGDQPYNELSQQLKDSLNEYYKVDSLENYESVYRGVAFFIFKHGRIDWLESNNEYWLERDAMLRSDFHITSGFQKDEIEMFRHKSNMKKYYEAAGIPVARYHLVDDWDGCMRFIEEVGYPLCTKPDNGVGASDTHKIENEEDLEYFFATKDPDVLYIMEEFIDGVVDSYDAIVDSNGDPIFESGTVSPISIMDIVNNNDNAAYHVTSEIPEDLKAAGRATVKSFGVKNRFVHFEFFRLNCDQHIGKAGDVVALEVNMRPCGGITPDMMNYAGNTNVYKIYADMIAYDSSLQPKVRNGYCAFAGRRYGRDFTYSEDEIFNKYGYCLKDYGPIDEALASTMGDYMYLAVFDDEDTMNQFYEDVIC